MFSIENYNTMPDSEGRSRGPKPDVEPRNYGLKNDNLS